jgi:hypothetical protein
MTCKRIEDQENRTIDNSIRGLLQQKLYKFIDETFNGHDLIPEYIRDAKVIPLSKNGSTIVEPNNIRFIAAYGEMMKIFESLILKAFQKVVVANPQVDWLFYTPNYQKGFKSGMSTEFPTV